MLRSGESVLNLRMARRIRRPAQHDPGRRPSRPGATPGRSRRGSGSPRRAASCAPARHRSRGRSAQVPTLTPAGAERNDRTDANRSAAPATFDDAAQLGPDRAASDLRPDPLPPPRRGHRTRPMRPPARPVDGTDLRGQGRPRHRGRLGRGRGRGGRRADGARGPGGGGGRRPRRPRRPERADRTRLAHPRRPAAARGHQGPAGLRGRGEAGDAAVVPQDGAGFAGDRRGRA